MIEIWKDVIGFEGLYQVSNLGNVRSMPRKGVGKNHLCKSAHTGQGGYGRMVLIKDGKRHYKMVHAMVLESFLCLRPVGALARHLDGDRTNNSLTNLAWGTAKENQADRKVHGTASIGESHGQSILTDASVILMREKRAAGASIVELSAEFGVTKTLVSTVCLGKAWAHVGGPTVSANEINNTRILDDKQVLEIRFKRAAGSKLKELASEYGVDHTAIASICTGKTRKSVGGPITRVKGKG